MRTCLKAAPDHLRATERGCAAAAAAARPEMVWPQGFSASTKKSASKSSNTQKTSVLVPLLVVVLSILECHSCIPVLHSEEERCKDELQAEPNDTN